jgi:hypothetical protein
MKHVSRFVLPLLVLAVACDEPATSPDLSANTTGPLAALTAGSWQPYPAPSTTYATSVQQPINTDGTSNFKANGKAVIPVKFALSSGTGAAAFESIYSDNTTSNDNLGTCGTGSGADHANDCAFLSFSPTSLTFGDLATLSASYAFTLGNCHGGALRWSVRTSAGSVFIYYGDLPNFTDCTSTSQSGSNMIGLSDLRYDTSQIGGTFYDTYANAVALVGASTTVQRVSLVLDAGWGGDQRLTLTSASVNDATFTPSAASAQSPTCILPEATVEISKTDGSPSGAVNEPLSIQPSDDNALFRTVDCKYMYNLATSSLSGVGTYQVSAVIGGVLATGPASFDLK